MVISNVISDETVITDIIINENLEDNTCAWIDIYKALKLGRRDGKDKLIKVGYDIAIEVIKLVKRYINSP